MFDTRPVVDLDAAISALRNADFMVATTGELDGVLRRLQTCADALVGVQARAVTAFEAQGGHEADGCARMSGWLRRELRLTPGEVRRTTRTAQTLAVLPEVAAAFGDGQLRPAHVDEFGDGLRKLADDTMRAAQDLLLPVARSCDPTELRKAIEHLHHVSDPDAEDKAWVQAQERQDINCRRAGHGWVVNGFLDAETGAMLSTALKAWGKPNGDGDKDKHAASEVAAVDPGVTGSADGSAGASTGAAEAGEATLWPTARRRIGGFKALLAGYLGSGGIPSDKGVRPHLNITVDHHTLLLALRGDRTTPAAQPATLAGYGYSGRDLIARLACDSTFGLTLVDATTDQHRHADTFRKADDRCGTSTGSGTGTGAGTSAGTNTGTSAGTSAGTNTDATPGSQVLGSLHPCGCPLTPYVHVLDVGRTERLATPRQRQAVLTAQGHRCAAPGCNNQHLEIHHIVAWADGGPTDVSNLIGLCPACHTLLHRGLLVCTSDGHGGAAFTRADGTVISDIRRRVLADYARDLRDEVSADLITAEAAHTDRQRRRREHRQRALGQRWQPSQQPSRQPEGEPPAGWAQQPEHRQPEHRPPEHRQPEQRVRQGADQPKPPWDPDSSASQPWDRADGGIDRQPPTR